MSFGRRKRERFERSDVPTASRSRSVIAVIAVVLVIVGASLLATTLWRRAHQVAGLGNRALRTAIRAQALPATPAEGFTSSGNDVSTVLVFADVRDGSLAQAQILALNATTGTATLAHVPLDTRLAVGDATVSLVAHYAEQGAAACVTPLASAANLQFTHVVVGDDTIWDSLGGLKGPELAMLLGPGADMLETMSSDLSSGGILELATQVQAVGIDRIRHIDVPSAPERPDDATSMSVINQALLGAEIGVLSAVETPAA